MANDTHQANGRTRHRVYFVESQSTILSTRTEGCYVIPKCSLYTLYYSVIGMMVMPGNVWYVIANRAGERNLICGLPPPKNLTFSLHGGYSHFYRMSEDQCVYLLLQRPLPHHALPHIAPPPISTSPFPSHPIKPFAL